MQIKAKPVKVNRPEKVFEIMRSVLKSEDEIDKKKEHFWVVGVNANLVVEYIELVSLGILDKSVVAPREIFRLAIMKAVDRIFLVHNPPSGNVKPSISDIQLTRQLVEAGKIIGINVIDHIIISENDYYSMRVEQDVQFIEND